LATRRPISTTSSRKSEEIAGRHGMSGLSMDP
jgi:hypothetical protein